MEQKPSRVDLVKLILKGIDQTEVESEDGWWETSHSADFGAKKLHQITALLAEEVAMTPAQTLDWLADQHRAQCGEDRPVQNWIRQMKGMLP